ncbi:hypothetical protein FCM35_KLT10315 [Carex littledalei]|uniref:protein-serine/threonine phosphatase n=1 Tax=Carex littledalei TaxID=544730 RepID=A0A833VIP2_9POAL|nr:hypothetical protein FCM35_KLT10315 [Carex littledalei]
MTPHKCEAEATNENLSPKMSKSNGTGVSSKSEEAVSGDASKVTCIETGASDDKCRQRMEDAWVLLPDANSENSRNLRCAHFAIYDGHGGRLAAKFAQKNLHANVLAAELVCYPFF